MDRVAVPARRELRSYLPCVTCAILWKGSPPSKLKQSNHRRIWLNKMGIAAIINFIDSSKEFRENHPITPVSTPNGWLAVITLTLLTFGCVVDA